MGAIHSVVVYIGGCISGYNAYTLGCGTESHTGLALVAHSLAGVLVYILIVVLAWSCCGVQMCSNKEAALTDHNVHTLFCCSHTGCGIGNHSQQSCQA